MSCLFCKIIAGEIPASKVYEDDRMIAFNDINPQAPMHVLVVPKKHVATLNDLTAAEDDLVGAMVRTAAKVA
ncbi:MAG TPA: HIT domain-containing protein, partial [Vicinamibacterales bacterium]|nr:HIT domain-containing protein [Vicinamibacterales bacterium]